MPTLEWLKQEFHYGYTSGDVMTTRPDEQRAKEERKIGGSYFNFYRKFLSTKLKPGDKVLELGPGQGSWTRAILSLVPEGEVHTCDFQDVSPWLGPKNYAGRLHCHQVEDNSFAVLPDDFFDVFFSFGVLVHCNLPLIGEILANSLPKVKPGGLAVHNYGDWNKLTKWGWEQGGVPSEFMTLPDDKIWWPRNTRESMVAIAEKSGWKVVAPDLEFFHRDGIILLERPAA
ncbi:methyltransferase domain-containing protein [Solidesulfovibrio sp.]